MEEDINASEDEWSQIKRRFGTEGLNWESTTPNQKSLQLFRWLVDAEDNLKTGRKINEKLRKQHEEEKKELGKYSDHLRQKCDSRVKEMESEVQALREDLEALLSGTQAISNIFRQEGLEDIANNSLGDQIAYLLVERSQMLEGLCDGKTSPTEQACSESFSKIKTEREILKTKNEELTNKTEVMLNRISHLEKSLKENEEHTENLSYKLSEALMEIEEKERIIKHFGKMGSELGPMEGGVASEPCSINYATSKTSNAKEPRNFNGAFRRKSSVFFERRDSLESRNGGSESPPRKLGSLFDSQILNSKSHLTHLNDIKKLQNEVERLKMNYAKAGRKYGELLRQFETLKLNSQNQVEMALKDQEWKMENLTLEIETLKKKLKIMEENKKDEENLRILMEKDLKELRNEKIEQVTKESETLSEMKNILEENLILKEKIKCFETEVKERNENLHKNIIEKIETDSQDQEDE